MIIDICTNVLKALIDTLHFDEKFFLEWWRRARDCKRGESAFITTKLQQCHNNHTAMPHQCHNNATTRLQQPNSNATAMCHHTRVPPSTRTCQHRRSLALSGLHGQPICFKTDQDYVNMPKIRNLRKIMEKDYEQNLLIAGIILRHKHL